MATHLVRVPDDQTIDVRQQGEPPLWPQEVLDRHGLLQLKPTEAVPIPVTDGEPVRRLRSTVYRAATVLIPDRIFRKGNEGPLPLIEEVVGKLGLQLIPPNLLSSTGNAEPYYQVLADLPRPAVLRAPDGSRPPDAWVVVQALRRAVLRDPRFGKLPEEDLVDVQRISIEHALSAAMIDPAPLSNPHPGTGDDAPVGWRGGYGRRPVTFIGRPPTRPRLRGGSRRPVIAIIDTGLGKCSWFGTSDISPPEPGYRFARTLKIAFELIHEQEVHVAGLTRSEVLLSPEEYPVYSDSISQAVAPATGHASFIGGLIRQYAPGADVLSIRGIHPDGVSYSGDVLLALYVLLAMQIRARDSAHPITAELVDVISLSLGCYLEDDAVRQSGFAVVLEKLTAEGVVVVAAAGNHSTARPYVPAALCAVPAAEWCGQRVIGVGALNSNATVAWFSNTAPSASILAPGANLISVFPDNIRGSINPPGGTQLLAGMNGPKREGADPDNYLAGAASWSGTSFAAPIVAAAAANLLISCVEDTKNKDEQDRVPDLDDHCREAKRARACAAVEALHSAADTALRDMANQV